MESLRYEFRKSEILYEDDYLIAVNKPSGLPSQSTLDPNRDHCYAAVQRYLQSHQSKVYVGLHHRLDVQTSGVLLMTKSERVNASISEQFQKHTIEKSYIAMCIGPKQENWEYGVVDQEWLIDRSIGELPKGRIQKFGIDGKQRKPARTRVKCHAFIPLRDGIFGVYECRPETGRTHQIRVHLSTWGLGIIGDSLYGIPLLRSLRSLDPHRMCLHAQELILDHPISQERLVIRAPMPEVMSGLFNRVKKINTRDLPRLNRD